MKYKIGLFVGLALTLTACPPAPDDFTARYDPLIDKVVFDAVQGNGYGTNISLCGLGSFSNGVVSASLENAPTGVSISKPSSLEFNLATACRTNAAGASTQAIVVTPKDLLIAVASNAPIINNQNFNFVFKSKNVTRKLAASISIKAPTQDFTAVYDPISPNPAVFDVVQNSNAGINVSLCGLGTFTSGNITVSLENAPTGVTLTKPAGNVFTLPTACRTNAAGLAPQVVVVTKDMFIGVAANAPIVSNQAFNFVFTSSDVVKKLPATISISAAPVLAGTK